MTTSSGSCGSSSRGGSSGDSGEIQVHCYVDGAYCSCIFGNETAITAMVAPGADAVAPVIAFSDGEGSAAAAPVMQLESWRLAL